MADSMQTKTTDYYANGKFQKYFDLSAGFFGAAVIWIITFHPYWYIAPVIICAVSGIALKRKVSRKYIPIGALGLFALPFMIWWSTLLFVMGINEE